MSASVDVKDQKTILGHPIGLFVLFFTEMWERFSYYGMRNLLKLYMVNYLFVTLRQATQGSAVKIAGDPSLVIGWDFLHKFTGGGANVGASASILYGWYTALVYLTPILGGYLADKYWGQRKAVYIGGILMAIGQFMLISDSLFFFALLVIILGNGAFKPNISTQVGALYPEGDSRRDGAFTLFYMGINLGALLCGLVCGTLAFLYGWKYGFASAGVGMILGLVVYTLGGKYLAPDALSRKKEAEKLAPVVNEPLTKAEWKRVWALVALVVLNVVFWMTFEQQGNILQTWSDEKTIWPMLGSFQIPSTWFQNFNPFFVFILAPVLDIFWRWKTKKFGKTSSSVGKMAFGCCVASVAFIVMAFGASSIGAGKGSISWLVVCALLLTIGELYLSPIGLSLVTKVSPVRIVSLMMGIWFLSSFFGNLLMGYVGVLYEKAILTPVEFFLLCAGLLGFVGLAMALFQGPLKKAIGSENS